jgi:hypothetical protein
VFLCAAWRICSGDGGAPAAWPLLSLCGAVQGEGLFKHADANNFGGGFGSG